MADNKMDVDNSDDWTALRNAIILQEPTLILDLLKQNVDFKCTDEDGNTVLHMVFKKYTFENNESLIIEMLNIFLDHGMDPNVMNNEGKTALHLAVKSRLCDVIDFLIRKGANLNIRDKDGDTIAHFLVDCEFDKYCSCCWSESYIADEKELAKKKSKNFVRWLFSKGLSVNHRNNDGLIPLHLAAQLNFQCIMLELLGSTRNCHINYLNNNNENILHSLFHSFKKIEPIGFKNKKKPASIPFREDKTTLSYIVQLLLDKRISVDTVDKNGNTTFHLAMRLTEPDVTDLILEKFTNVNARDKDGNTVLHIILMDSRKYNSHIYDDYIRILLSKGANINIKNNDGLVPLQIAVFKHRVKIVKLLKKHGANFQVLHEKGNLLHFFTTRSLTGMDKTNSRSAIDLLVSEGCDVNYRNQFGMTPLHLALRSENVNVIDRLIELGADMKAQDLSEHKYTTLHLAVMYGYEDLVDRFVKAGVDVNAQDANGRTPLHWTKNNVNILKKMLHLNAYVDLYDYEGNSPLHMAIKSDNIEGVIALLHYGADIKDVNTRIDVESLLRKKRMSDVIIRHWIKLKNVCLPVIEWSRVWIDAYYRINGSSIHCELNKFRKECAIEVQKLKEPIFEGNISFYDFLHMNRNRQCVFVKRHDIKTKLYDFPIYEPVIFGAYHQAKVRTPVLRLAVSVWYELTNYYLPEVCVEHIYSYLSNANLRDVIQSVQN